MPPAAATKSAGSLVHGFNRLIEWRIVGLLAAGSVPASAVTLWWLSASGTESIGAAHVLALVLGAMLVLTALSLLLRHQLTKFAGHHRELPPRARDTLTVVTGLVLGVLLCGSIPGILIATRLAPKLDERVVRWLLAIILVIVGLRLAFG